MIVFCSVTVTECDVVSYNQHHYLGFFISKSHIHDLNPTFGFQKPNLTFTNLIYKRALTRVLKKNNLGFKNQIWLFKLSFENQIFQLENRISKTTFIFKTHIWFMYWNPNSFFENQICFISKNHVWFFETHMCVMKPKCEHCTKHKYGFVNPCLIFKTHMCVMKPKFDFYTKHKYGFVNPHLFFKTHTCVMKSKFDPYTKHKYGFVNPHFIIILNQLN